VAREIGAQRKQYNVSATAILNRLSRVEQLSHCIRRGSGWGFKTKVVDLLEFKECGRFQRPCWI